MSLDQLSTPSRGPSRCDVALLRWPAQEALRERLEAEGRPRLLLLAHECLAPVCADELEDWVREPIDKEEVELRGRRLVRRAQQRGLRPMIDDNGFVRVGDRWVDFPPIQLPVARLLVSRIGRVVTARDLRDAYVAAGGSRHPKAVKAMIGRVKRRLEEVGLVLVNVRDRGYVLEVDSRSAPPAR